MASKKEMERAIVAGASAALKHRAKSPNATDEEIIQTVVRELQNMLGKID